jgi:hypothetical protein
MNEQAIRKTIDDFHKFCRYIAENNPVLTKAKTQLGKKDLFEINALLHFRKDVAAPNYQQESFLFVLVFPLTISIILVGAILYRLPTATGKSPVTMIQ